MVPQYTGLCAITSGDVLHVQERTAKAEALKQEGNALYAEGKHVEAQVITVTDCKRANRLVHADELQFGWSSVKKVLTLSTAVS